MTRINNLFLIALCIICIKHIYAKEYDKTVTVHPTYTVFVDPEDASPTPSVDIVKDDAGEKKFFKHTTLPNLSMPDVEIPTKPGEYIKATSSPTPKVNEPPKESSNPKPSALPSNNNNNNNDNNNNDNNNKSKNNNSGNSSSSSTNNNNSNTAKPTNDVKVQPEQPKKSAAIQLTIPSYLTYTALFFVFIQFLQN